MKRSIGNGLAALARDEAGLSTVEYVVLLVLIVAMAVGAWNTFGSRVQGKLNTASNTFDTQVRGGAVGGGQSGSSGDSPGMGNPVTE